MNSFTYQNLKNYQFTKKNIRMCIYEYDIHEIDEKGGEK